jgi:hypothetical protein
MKNGDKPINPSIDIIKEDFSSQTIKHNGLTKREYFAALAMQGLIARSEALGINAPYITSTAVYCADALLAELDKKPNT